MSFLKAELLKTKQTLLLKSIGAMRILLMKTSIGIDMIKQDRK